MAIRNAAASKLVNPKVLIFGPKAFFPRVSSEFERLGYEPFTMRDLGVALPSPFDSDAHTKLKAIFSTFCIQAGDLPEGRNHAVYPGVTHWSERAELASLGAEFGLDVLTPSQRILSLFGSKLGLIEAADRLQIPHSVVSFDPIQTLREATVCLEREYGPNWSKKAFPVVFKSVRGGVRGLGVRVFYSLEDLEREFTLWIDQIRSITGEANVIPERYLEGARYLMQPFVRFADGRMRLFPMVDASLQMRRRRMVEFCPVENVDTTALKNIDDWTRKFARNVGFVGVGSFDYLCDGDRTYLIDGLARLNYGYHLWEQVAGTSAIQWQMSTMGLCPEPEILEAPHRSGWACGASVRLYAEDSILQLPSPGTLFEFSKERNFAFPAGRAELESGYDVGESIPSDSAGLLGILWAEGVDRTAVVANLENALKQIWITGSLNTNENYISQILSHHWVREGAYHASFLEEEFVPELRPPESWLKCLTSVFHEIMPDRPAPGFWLLGEKKSEGMQESVTWDLRPEKFVAGGYTGFRGRLILDDQIVPICAFPIVENRWLVRIGSWRVGVRWARVGGAPFLSALCEGRVRSLLFMEGAIVKARESMAIIESLQVLVGHALPVSVRLLEWKVKAEQNVGMWEPLAILERHKQ